MNNSFSLKMRTMRKKMMENSLQPMIARSILSTNSGKISRKTSN